jgi:hypothetical protein
MEFQRRLLPLRNSAGSCRKSNQSGQDTDDAKESEETSAGDESFVMPRASVSDRLGAQQLLIEFADLLDRRFESLIIRQTTLYLRHLFFAETDLAGARSGIADGEDRNRVPFAAVALGGQPERWRMLRSSREPRRVWLALGRWAPIQE